MATRFIKPIQHQTWMSNIVPIKNKNGQIREYVDYRDVNKPCLKDDFPLPNMDVLIDSTSEQRMLSFMDGLSGYNKIKRSLKDTEKTTFRKLFDNFFYTVMSFGLKNEGTTYQQTMTTIFHGIMGRKVDNC